MREREFVDGRQIVSVERKEQKIRNYIQIKTVKVRTLIWSTLSLGEKIMASSFCSLSLPEMLPCAIAAAAVSSSITSLVGAAVIVLVKVQRKSDAQRRVILRRDMLLLRTESKLPLVIC